MFDAFGNDTQVCTGAQLVATAKSLLVLGYCGTEQKQQPFFLRRSGDWGRTWERTPISLPFPPGPWPKLVFDPAMGGAVLAIGDALCPGYNATHGSGCPPQLTCVRTSRDEGSSWSPPTPVGAYNSGEGCGGTVLSTGEVLSAFGLGNCSSAGGRDPNHPSFDVVAISSDHGTSWAPGAATPPLPQAQGWGEAAVAELANGSVVLTSRLAQSVAPHAQFAGLAPVPSELAHIV